MCSRTTLSSSFWVPPKTSLHDSCPQFSCGNNNFSHLSSSWRFCESWQASVCEVWGILRWRYYINIEECNHSRQQAESCFANNLFSWLGAIGQRLCYSATVATSFINIYTLTHSPWKIRIWKSNYILLKHGLRSPNPFSILLNGRPQIFVIHYTLKKK